VKPESRTQTFVFAAVGLIEKPVYPLSIRGDVPAST
jgi:hypothetical protein